MPSVRRIKDSRGRVWTLTQVDWTDAEASDDRFWQEQMTAEERVVAVYGALESSLKARGINAVPRFRRVHRLRVYQSE